MKEKLAPKMLKTYIPVIVPILKYLFALFLTFWAFSCIGNPCYLVADILELLIIFSFSNLLMKKKTAGRIVNDILMLFYNAQMIVMVFGNSYITMVMLTNIDSLQALSGKAGIYAAGVVLVLVFSFLPVYPFEFKNGFGQLLLSLVLCLELAFTMVYGNRYSPIYGYFDLAIQYRHNQELTRTIQAAVNEAANEKAPVGVGNSAVDAGNTDDPESRLTEGASAETTAMSSAATENMASAAASNVVLSNHADPDLSYYHDGVTDYRAKDAALPNQPNVILIFTEGLSQNIVSDERNITPNISAYQNRSLYFTNYYNHTFATFRGLIGQLYSGYQLENYDTNALVSLQDVFSELGYYTAFINTEPFNGDFTPYLENLGFDELIGNREFECNGMANTISDKDAYEILFDSAMEQSASGVPFFLAIYTFGTHASLDSADETFGDGTDAELNKFYNMDCQFGQFMERFVSSTLSDNTIVVFTADHATYQDDSFNTAFPDYIRANTSCDAIPLFIYYKGITAEGIDVNGRNTLDLAPTLLDYLDISAPNHFLGTSLFADEECSLCETSYSDSFVLYTTKNAQIGQLEGTELDEFNTLLQEYYIAKEVAASKQEPDEP